jgi:cation-transporting ATPase E
VYATLIAAWVVIAGWRYPFLPRHLTIVSLFTIGIPGFFLAIAPNTQRYLPGFIRRVLQFTVPAGAIAAISALVTYWFAFYGEDLPLEEARTAATLTLVAIGLWVLVILARPFTLWRGLLVGAMVACVAGILVIPWLRDFYALDIPDGAVLGEMAGVVALAIVALEISYRLTRAVVARREKAQLEQERGEREGRGERAGSG